MVWNLAQSFAKLEIDFEDITTQWLSKVRSQNFLTYDELQIALERMWDKLEIICTI